MRWLPNSAPLDSLRHALRAVGTGWPRRGTHAIIVLRTKGDPVYGGSDEVDVGLSDSQQACRFRVLAMNTLLEGASIQELNSRALRRLLCCFPASGVVGANSPAPEPSPDVAPSCMAPNRDRRCRCADGVARKTCCLGKRTSGETLSN